MVAIGVEYVARLHCVGKEHTSVKRHSVGRQVVRAGRSLEADSRSANSNRGTSNVEHGASAGSHSDIRRTQNLDLTSAARNADRARGLRATERDRLRREGRQARSSQRHGASGIQLACRIEGKQASNRGRGRERERERRLLRTQSQRASTERSCTIASRDHHRSHGTERRNAR